MAGNESSNDLKSQKESSSSNEMRNDEEDQMYKKMTNQDRENEKRKKQSTSTTLQSTSTSNNSSRLETAQNDRSNSKLGIKRRPTRLEPLNNTSRTHDVNGTQMSFNQFMSTRAKLLENDRKPADNEKEILKWRLW
jgi:hypothetical protein